MFSTGSTVVIQWENGGLWTHRVVVDPYGINYSGHSYTISVRKTGTLNTKHKAHMGHNSINRTIPMRANRGGSRKVADGTNGLPKP